MSKADRDDTSVKLEQRTDGVLERGLGSAWEQLAPLSVGAVASAAVILGVTGLLRRVLGPSRRVLGWAGAVALLPIGYWLLSDTVAETAEAADEASDGSRAGVTETDQARKEREMGEVDGG